MLRAWVLYLTAKGYDPYDTSRHWWFAVWCDAHFAVAPEAQDQLFT